MRVPRPAVNCSILLTQLPLAQRFEAVRAVGVEAVELWWPFASAEPAAAEVDAFITTLTESGLELIALNLFAGDMAAGDRGVLAYPDRVDEFAASVAVAVEIARRTGCRRFTALWGVPDPRADDDVVRSAVDGNLRLAAASLGAVDAVVLLEPLSGVPGYPLRTADDVVEEIERAEASGAGGIAMLLDVYHLTSNGDDVDAVIERHRHRIGHVQLADAPGRGRPGTGEAPLARWIEALETGGYDGRYALEYKDDSAAPLAWLREETA